VRVVISESSCCSTPFLNSLKISSSDCSLPTARSVPCLQRARLELDAGRRSRPLREEFSSCAVVSTGAGRLGRRAALGGGGAGVGTKSSSSGIADIRSPSKSTPRSGSVLATGAGWRRRRRLRFRRRRSGLGWGRRRGRPASRVEQAFAQRRWLLLQRPRCRVSCVASEGPRCLEQR